VAAPVPGTGRGTGKLSSKIIGPCQWRGRAETGKLSLHSGGEGGRGVKHISNTSKTLELGPRRGYNARGF